MRPDRTLYLITIRFTIRRIIDSSTLRIFDHENWPNISRKTLAKLVKRETLRLSMNGRGTFGFRVLISQLDGGPAVPRPAGVGRALDQGRQVPEPRGGHRRVHPGD